MSEQYLTLAEVRELLTEETEKRGDEAMLTSQKAALDHAQKVCSISLEQARAIYDEALKMDIVTEAVALKIADLLPKHPEDVRAIFSKERVVLDPEQIQEVLDIVERNL